MNCTIVKVTKVSGSVTAGGVTVAFENQVVEAETPPRPGEVRLTGIDAEGDRYTVWLPPQDLETAGKLAERLRRDLTLDFRGHCIDHGYHDGFRCPQCPDTTTNPTDVP